MPPNTRISRLIPIAPSLTLCLSFRSSLAHGDDEQVDD